MKVRQFFPVVLATVAVALVTGGLTPKSVDLMIAEGRDDSHAKALLDQLCSTIGGRATGTPELARAEQWALAKFKSYGLENVHLEKWGTAPQTFERGPRQVGRVVAPFERDLVFTTNCYTSGTQGPVRGPVYREPVTPDEAFRMGEKLKGAWILMPGIVSMGGARLANPSAMDRRLDLAGIAGRIYTTGKDLVWTHGRWTDYTDETRPKTPLVTIRGADYDDIAAEVDAGRPVTVEFDIDNRIIDKPIDLHNVVADVRGSEMPDEYVIVCAHLDSWNGPGSKGAQDNGTGACSVLEAARLMVFAGARPKRTVRFILWTGEEQGLLGSSGYVDAHLDELDKISAVLNEDSGANTHEEIDGTSDMIDVLRQAVAPMRDAFPGYPVLARQVDRFPLGGGSDHVSFTAKGVPGFTFQKRPGLDYRHIWHTQYDTPDLVPAENLAQMATDLAVVSFGIANADRLLPRLTKGQRQLRAGN